MTITVFLILLTVFSTATSLVTEGVKAFLNDAKIQYSSNMVVLIIALFVGVGGTAFYLLQSNIVFSALNCIYAVLMGVANWLGAMVGYDKVRQMLMQIGA